MVSAYFKAVYECNRFANAIQIKRTRPDNLILMKPISKGTTLILFLCALFLSHKNVGQTQKYFSIGVGVNQSTFLLRPGVFVEGELTRMWAPRFYPSPELFGQFNIDLDKRNTLALTSNIVFYQRILGFALPITLKYDFRCFDQKNTPFIRLEGGYSFFLTNGLFYGMGVGYQFNNFKASFAYNNQFKNRSILENNDFVAARIASMSLKFEYAFRKNRRRGRR